MKENNEFENLKKERSNLLINKSQGLMEKSKSKVSTINESNLKHLKNQNQKQEITKISDVMKMSEFLNDHIKNLEQDLHQSAEIRFGNKDEEKDFNYLNLIEDFKKEKLLDNNIFFYNGKEFIKSQPEKSKKGIKLKSNIAAEKNTAVYRINPITKCQINFSDDENTDVNHNSDIDVYLED